MSAPTQAKRERCCSKLWRWGHMRDCRGTSCAVRDGKSYCRMHDPEAIKKRAVERYRKQEMKRIAMRAKWSREGQQAAALAALGKLVAALDAFLNDEGMPIGFLVNNPALAEARAVLQQGEGK